MSEMAIAALFDAVRIRLTAPGQMWAGRAYPNLAGADATYPYVVYFWSGGGERNRQKGRDAEIVLTIKAVSDKLPEAFDAAAAVDDLLNDHGAQDADAQLTTGAGSEWAVLTATAEETIAYQEMKAGAQPIYHAGARYRFVMEAS
ncbi:MAG: hypothetical protein LC121_13455 [Anaerolineae bacterium]|nr:hypothetical protein [Anaerolineae bacterium]